MSQAAGSTPGEGQPGARGRGRRRAVAVGAALGAAVIVLAIVRVIARPSSPVERSVDAGVVDAGAALAAPSPPTCTTAADCADRCGPPVADPAACARHALMTALLDDRSAAPAWIDPRAAPAGRLDAACRTGGERGGLACAAIELLRVQVAEPAEVRARLAACPLGSAAACATAIVQGLCEREAMPEACYLAARAPGSGVDSPETLALATTCQRTREPMDCHYAWLASGRPELLALACPDEPAAGAGPPAPAPGAATRAAASPRAVARACLDRAYLLRPRRRELNLRGCRLGLCDRITDVAALTAACEAGVLDGCARLLAAPVRQVPPASRAAAHARAAALAPAVDLAEPAAPLPATLRPAYEACRYGVADACDAVVAELPPASGLRGPLTAYAARLRKPLSP